MYIINDLWTAIHASLLTGFAAACAAVVYRLFLRAIRAGWMLQDEGTDDEG